MEEQKTRNPWLGLESYKEGEILFGRDDDIRELTQCVLKDTDTLLYGKSGIGKSSIINAGVIPAARRHGYLPVLVRFSHKEQHTYLNQIKENIANTLMPIPLDESGNQLALSISEQQKRQAELKTRIREVVECKNPQEESLYEFFHRYTFHNTEGKRIKLLIIFDQFEEIFSLQTDETKKRRFFTELADLLNDVMPTGLQYSEIPHKESQKEIAVIGSGNFGNLFNDLDIAEENNLPEYVIDNEIHMVFTIREDFLSEFEYYTASIPSLKQNRYGLRSINEEQAAQIIMRPIPGLISKSVATMIIEKVTGRTDVKLEGIPKIEVNAALLSLYMKQLYERKHEKEKIITSELVHDSDDIIKVYYEDSIKGIPETSIAQLENELITNADKRDNVARIDLISRGISEDDLNKLIDKKVLIQFSYGGDLRIEFIHDVLCPIVVDRINKRELLAKEKEARRIEEENRRIKKQNDSLNKIRSLFLSEKAINCSKDRYLSQMLALEALPGDIEHPDKPLVPQAEAALRKTVHIPYCPMIGHNDTVTRVLATSDGKHVFSSSRDGKVCVWDAFSGAQLKEFNCGKDGASTISVHENAGKAVVANSKGGVQLYSMDSFKVIDCFSLDEALPKVVAISPDGLTVAVGSENGNVMIHTSDQRTLLTHPDIKSIDTLLFSPNGKELIAMGEGRIEYCSVTTGDWSKIDDVLIYAITCVDYSKDGKYLFCGTENGKIVVVEVCAGKREKNDILECENADCKINAISLSPNTKRIAYSVGGKLMILERDAQFYWSPQKAKTQGGEYHSTKTCIWNDDFSPIINCIAWSPDNRYVLWGNVEGSLSMYDTCAGPQPRELLKAKSYMKALFYVPAGDKLCCISNHDTFRVIEMKSGKVTHREDHYKNTLGKEFQGANQTYRAEYNIARKVVELYNDDNQTAKHTFVLDSELTSVAFSSDSTLLALAQKNGTVTCWDTDSGKRKYVLDGYRSINNTVLFSPKGGIVATTSPKGEVRIWDEGTGSPKYVIPAEGGYVYSLAFSPDGDRLVIGTETGTTRIWNIEAKEQVDLLDRNQEGICVRLMAFSPDGEQLYVSYDDGTLLVWPCPSLKKLVEDTRERLNTRAFSAEEKRKYYLEEG